VNGERCVEGNSVVSIVVCFESRTVGEIVGGGD
jgi:hypothetical protein